MNIRRLLTTALCLMTMHSAIAQDKKIDDAIKHRRAAFTLMSTYVGRLVQTVEGGRPYDKALTIADARVVEQLSQLPWEGFVAGSERGHERGHEHGTEGVKTRAKDDVWLDEERFKQLSSELKTRSTALVQATETGDMAQIKTAVDRTRQTCNACHKAFRSE